MLKSVPVEQSHRIGRWLRTLLVSIGIAAILTLQPDHLAHAANPSKTIQPPNWATAGDFGGVGLIQSRTARFRDDGEMDIGTTFLDPYRRYYISFQAMPWLEGTFRYTEITNRSFSIGGLASNEDFQDRGADLKFLLLKESNYAPQIAFGLQDGIGTGLFAGEFLVANKGYYDLDFSFGIGWGYFASGSTIKNPLITFSNVFRTRNSGGSFGGEANFGDYLSGESVGLFGGVAWRTPIKGLSLKLETGTQDYQSEPLGNRFERDQALNLGFVYKPFPWLELSGAYERGNTTMFRASLRANVNDAGLPKLDPPPPKLTPRPARTKSNAEPARAALEGDADFTLAPKLAGRFIQPGDPKAITPGAPGSRLARGETGNAGRVEALFAGFEAQAMQISSVETTADETKIYLSTGLREAPKWRQVKAAQLVADALPSSSGRVTLIERQDELIVHQVTLGRSEIERGTIVDYLFDSLEAKGFTIDSIDFNHS
nr:YjbH domain-containing protein [Alphaproteobacteria bacterium]